MFPTLIPIFDVVIDNLAIGRHGQLYANGYGNGAQQLPQPQLAQWDGEKWIALDPGFQPEHDALVVDRAGHLYVDVLTNSPLRRNHSLNKMIQVIQGNPVFPRE